jgi:hypothetical protein
MDGIWVNEVFRPQPIAQLNREGLSQFFAGELEPVRVRILVDELQMSKLMKKHVIEHKSADSKDWPFVAPFSAELLGCLTFHEGSCQAHPGR